MQGRLIVFEGGEGSGKTTQLTQTYQWLQESQEFSQLQTKRFLRGIVTTREPGGTQLGSRLRQLLLNPLPNEEMQNRAELLMYAADRAQHVETILRPGLAAGNLILCDRYTDSTVAYQGYGRGVDLALIQQLNQIATDGLQSDLTLWLDVNVEVGLGRMRQRGAADRIEQADLAFHQRVRQGFAELAAQHPQRIVRIDANQTVEAIQQDIRDILSQQFQRWYGAELRAS